MQKPARVPSCPPSHQVVTTSSWTRERLLLRYPLPPDKVHVAEPGVDPAELASGTDRGGELLCVAAVTRAQGPRRVARCAGHHRGPAVAVRLRRDARPSSRCSSNSCGFGPKQPESATGSVFSGLRIGDDLAHAYATADVLVLASRAETYGMVVTEALARGLPVIATAVGGLPEALGGPTMAADPGCWCRPATASRWPPRCASG